MTTALLNRICNDLATTGAAIVDDFLPSDVLTELKAGADLYFSEGGFQLAQVGKGTGKQEVSEIRSDKVMWITAETKTGPVQVYWKEMEFLMEGLSTYFRIHLARFEAHLAVYPVGSFYLRHLDQFREHANRIFSCILYLNENWKEPMGGALRIYGKDNGHQDIYPEFGRFVCFRSDLVEHEVLPTLRERYSLTGWMRRDEIYF